MIDTAATAAGGYRPKDFIVLKRILWALVPVIASRVLSKRAGRPPRANKTRYRGRFGR